MNNVDLDTKLNEFALKRLGSRGFDWHVILLLLNTESVVNNNDFKIAMTQRETDKNGNFIGSTMLEKIAIKRTTPVELREKISQIKQYYLKMSQC